MRVGLLTAGGDCSGLNAAIRAVVKHLVFQHGAEVVGVLDGYLGLIERRVRRLGARDASGILLQGGTILGTENRADPFQWHGAGGPDVSDAVIAYARELGLDGLIVIGGDGSMTVADKLHRKGLPIVGIPKTIDNDLVGTELTIGFDTAVSIAAEAVDRIQTTTQSHHRVFLIETMGRYAGWLALHAGMASGADVILIPEVPYDEDAVVEVCHTREAKGPRFTIMVVAEGVALPSGELGVREVVKGSPEALRLGGVSGAIAARLKLRLGAEVRAMVLGHMQRGGAPTPTDRVLATMLASHAVGLFVAGKVGRMAAIQDGRLVDVAIAACAGHCRKVPPDAPLLATARAVGVSLGERA